MQEAGKWIKDPESRKYIYGVIGAIGAALVGYQIITQEELLLWLNIAGQVLLVGGSTLAFVNTNKKLEEPQEDELPEIFVSYDDNPRG